MTLESQWLYKYLQYASRVVIYERKVLVILTTGEEWKMIIFFFIHIVIIGIVGSAVLQCCSATVLQWK